MLIMVPGSTPRRKKTRYGCPAVSKLGRSFPKKDLQSIRHLRGVKSSKWKVVRSREALGVSLQWKARPGRSRLLPCRTRGGCSWPGRRIELLGPSASRPLRHTLGVAQDQCFTFLLDLARDQRLAVAHLHLRAQHFDLIALSKGKSLPREV